MSYIKLHIQNKYIYFNVWAFLVKDILLAVINHKAYMTNWINESHLAASVSGYCSCWLTVRTSNGDTLIRTEPSLVLLVTHVQFLLWWQAKTPAVSCSVDALVTLFFSHLYAYIYSFSHSYDQRLIHHCHICKTMLNCGLWIQQWHDSSNKLMCLKCLKQ